MKASERKTVEDMLIQCNFSLRLRSCWFCVGALLILILKFVLFLMFFRFLMRFLPFYWLFFTLMWVQNSWYALAPWRQRKQFEFCAFMGTPNTTRQTSRRYWLQPELDANFQILVGWGNMWNISSNKGLFGNIENWLGWVGLPLITSTGNQTFPWERVLSGVCHWTLQTPTP